MDTKSKVFIVAALAAAFLIGANTNGVPDEIRAKRFVVVDDDGKEMLLLKSSKSGGHSIVYGKGEKVAALIRSDKHGGILAIASIAHFCLDPGLSAGASPSRSRPTPANIRG